MPATAHNRPVHETLLRTAVRVGVESLINDDPTICIYEEWQQAARGGDRDRISAIAEGHTVGARELAQALGFHVEHGPEVDEDFLEYAGGMTVRLDDLPAAESR